MEKDKIIEELNSNIKELVHRLIYAEKEQKKYYCPYPDKQDSCDSECNKCIDKYYREYEQQLVNKYTITEY